MLTAAQLATLKADILAQGDTNTIPLTYAGSVTICNLYNTLTATDGWRTDAQVSAIYDAIDWSKFTPVDAPDGTALCTNRLLSIQTKQMNLQSMLQGKSNVDASKANLRAGLRDAVISLPAGSGGAAVTAGGTGGVTVLNALTRKITRAEKLFGSSTATTGTVTANLLTWEGLLTVDDVQAAREG